MTYLITIVILSILICSSFAELSCSKNEVEVKCPHDCQYDENCPKDAKQDETICSRPDVCPPPACLCRFNYRRHDNGTCINIVDCPPIDCPGVNEVYDPCPPYCPSDDCSEASPSGRCLFPILGIRECFPTCRCKEGYWRKDGVCVPYKECPPNKYAELLG